MSRRRTHRVHGPYRVSKNRWVVWLVDPDKDREPRYFDDESRAQEAAAGWRKELERRQVSQDHTTESARKAYETYLTKKENKPGSIYRTMWSLKRFFPAAIPLWGITKRRCKNLYEELVGTGLAVDSHRNALAEVKTFLDWVVEQGWLPSNPCSEVEGTGRRKKGKPQLRVSEARTWFRTAMNLANDGDEGALAALMTVVLGVRSNEVVTRLVRDLDEDELPCDLLWIPDSKTEAGRRAMEVPEDLRVLLEEHIKGKAPRAPIFPPTKMSKDGPRLQKTKTGFRDRGWPTDQVKRICELAGVDEVTAHGLRGMHTRLALRGSTSHVVEELLKQVGHTDKRTTEGYSGRSAMRGAETASVIRVLKGGESGKPRPKNNG